MAAELITLPFRPVINARGVLEPGALLDVYQTGTTTRVTIYTDADLSVEATNPVVADASGVFPSIYFDNATAVRVRVRQANGTVIGDADPYFSDGFSSTDIGIQRAEAGGIARQIASVVQETVMSVKDFGALGDNSTDDTAALNAALAAAKLVGGRLVFPSGIYLHTGLSATELRFVKLEGVARGSFGSAGANGVRLVCTAAAANHIDLINPHGVRIADLQMETHPTVTPTAGAAIRLYGTNGSAAYVSIENVRIEKHFNGILNDGLSNSDIRDCLLVRGIGTSGINLVGSAKRVDQVRYKGIIINSEVVGGSLTQHGFVFGNDVHTVWIEDCSALQARWGYYVTGAIPAEFLYFEHAEAEACNSHGFVIDKTKHLRIEGGYSSINGGHGYLFSGSFASTARMFAPDARGNAQHGILLDGSGGVEIIAPRIGMNSNGTPGAFHGIAVGGGVGNFSVIGGKIGGDINLQGTGAQGYGIFVNGGASNNYRILGVDLQGNQAGGLNDEGTGTSKRIRDNLGANDYGTSRGAVTVTTGNTTGNFAHGLGGTPSRVQVTPRGDPGARFWATATSTDVVVNLSAAAGADITFDIEAVI